MTKNIEHLIKDISKIDLEDIRSDWQWKLTDQKDIVIVSLMGDIFLTGNNDEINWPETGTGRLRSVAKNLEEFESLLNNQTLVDSWLLPSLIKQLSNQGKIPNENEVYSFKIMPALGGGYSIDNFDTTDISVHFSITGQIHQQIKDLPDGTRINNVGIVRHF